MSHITFQTLIDYLENRLDTLNQEQVVIHLVACPLCQRELDATRRLIGTQNEGLVAPPANLINRALASFRRRQRRSAQRTRPDPTLQFDSWTPASAVGTRGQMQERQLLYSFDTYDLDLQIERESTTHLLTLRGQILLNAPKQTELEGFEVCLHLPEGETRLGLTDVLGCFRLSNLPEGMGSLQITVDDADLIVEALTLQG